MVDQDDNYMVKKYFSISIAKHGENRVVQDRTKWSKIGGLTVVQETHLKVLTIHKVDICFFYYDVMRH